MGIMGDASGDGSPSSIRLATARDAAPVAAIYAPNVTETVISFESEPPDEASMRRRIEATLGRYPWLVCERWGRVLGYAYAGAHGSRAAYRWSVDVSVYVHAEAHRTGVGRALYASLFAALRLQGFYNAYAGATLPNPASVGLHEAMGFRPVGVVIGAMCGIMFGGVYAVVGVAVGVAVGLVSALLLEGGGGDNG